MYGTHDLRIAASPNSRCWHRSLKACARAHDVRARSLLEEHAYAGGVLDGRAAESNAMVAHQHREVRPERLGQRKALIDLSDQCNVVAVARNFEKIVGIQRKRPQRLRRCGKHATVEGMRMRNHVYIGPHLEDFRMYGPFGMPAAFTCDFFPVERHQNEILRAAYFPETYPVPFHPKTAALRVPKRQVPQRKIAMSFHLQNAASARKLVKQRRDWLY